MESQDLFKKFDPFKCTPASIFLHYDKESEGFPLPNCKKNKKRKCRCFSERKNVEFSFDYPMSFILISKKHIQKNLLARKKHNNFNIITLNTSANFISRNVVFCSLDEHLNTLIVFRKFLDYVRDVKKCNLKIAKYSDYHLSQFVRTENYIQESKNSQIAFVVYIALLYNHYHTLKIFEHFVNKVDLKNDK
jgi:hypothetical protein